jgi:hypothetical protein
VKQVEDGISWILSPVELPNCAGGETVVSAEDLLAGRKASENNLRVIFGEKPID